ncbi:unnamed protein product [Rotaria socialis]|uniref:Uncharacterized protein n=1 Tax=Rotaria socialis TaxID=392032 RepID=A0A818XH63_9BILA|nr:unnamed protein product [Rotaria socialis]
MAKTNQVSIWEVSTNDRHNKLNSHVDDDEEGRPIVRRRLALRLLAQQQLQPLPQQRLQPLLRQLLAQQQLRPVQLQRLQPQRLQQVRALPLQALQALPLQLPAQQQLRPVQPQRLRAPLPLAQQQLLQQVHHQHRLVLQLRLLQQPQLLRQALLHQLHQCRRQLQLVLPQQPLQQQHHKQQRVQLQVQQQHQLQLRQQRLVRCTTCVTFDNIPGQLATTGVVPNGYNNLNWTNVWYVNASTEPTSGYEYDVTSPPFVGTNPGGATVKITSANGTSFAFDSVIVTSAWRDDLYWVIYGYRNGVNTVAGGFYMQVANQTIISCGSCTNLDTLYFVVSGGTPHVGLAQTGYESAFDNLCISFGY